MEDKKELFKHGPLYASRREIVEKIEDLIQSGDIFVRLGNESFLGIPFSRLTAKFTESDWSHASIALREGKDVYLAEVNDRGTQKDRLIDWIDFCTSGSFAVYRLKDGTPEEFARLEQETTKFLADDPDYDFTFNSDENFYCTESVCQIYRRAGIEGMAKPQPMKELIQKRTYYIVLPFNWIIGKIWKKKIPMDIPLFIVGNAKKGILSSKRLACVLKHEQAEDPKVSMLTV